MMFWRKQPESGDRIYDSVVVGSDRVLADGKSLPALSGQWMTYVPATGEKFLMSREGLVARATQRNMPPESLEDSAPWGRYTVGELRATYATSVADRLARTLVVADRLAANGLGPHTIGLVYARSLVLGDDDVGFGLGMVVEDARLLRWRRRVTAADLARVGIADCTRVSCLQEQLHGYILDITSMIGPQPLDAAGEIAAQRARIERFVAAAAGSTTH